MTPRRVRWQLAIAGIGLLVILLAWVLGLA